MFRFLEANVREQKKYGKRIQTSVDNTENDLLYGIKFGTYVKNKKSFLLSRTLLFSFLNKNIFCSGRRIFLRFLKI